MTRFGKLLAGVALSALIGSAAMAEAVPTGTAAPELEVIDWVQGKPVTLADKRGKEPVVILFWTISRNGTQPFDLMAEAAKEFAGKAQFIAIGCDGIEAIRENEEIRRLPFPVAADRQLATVNHYMRKSDRIPMVAVVDPEGRLVWRGHAEQLYPVLKQLTEGKFDLNRALEQEKFSFAVGDALAQRDYDTVLKLLEAEQQKYPAALELLTLKVRILADVKKDHQAAIAAIGVFLQRDPALFAPYSLGLKVLKDHGSQPEVAAWLDRIIRQFGDNPELLASLAQNELTVKQDRLRLDNTYKLMHAAWVAPKFENDREKGLIGLRYANVLYLCGRPDRALVVAKEAEKLLAGQPEHPQAASAVAFYHQIIEVGKTIQ